MWLFGAKKKKEQPKPEHLENGELPWGWLYRNKDFVDQIQNEYTYFLNRWINSKTGTPIEEYGALKSFVIYLEDTEKLCKSKGECFEFWFTKILASPDYIAKRKRELEELTTKLKNDIDYDNQRG